MGRGTAPAMWPAGPPAGADQAELGDRAMARDEAGVGGATTGVQLRLRAAGRRNCAAQRLDRAARLGDERLAADRDIQVESLGVLRQHGAQPGGQRGPGVAVVEPDVQRRAGRRRDHVGRGVADIEAGELQARWFEPLGAGVQRGGGQRGDGPHQAVHRVVGAVGIGDVALRAVHGDPGVQAAAAADLDHVAELHRAGRFAHETEIRDLLVLDHPVQHAHGAVDRVGFLIAGDQQADRAVRKSDHRCGPRRQKLCHGGDEGGDTALHVAGAAAVEHAVVDLGAERIMTPVRRADRHDVGVPGEADVWRPLAEPGEQVLDRAIA